MNISRKRIVSRWHLDRPALSTTLMIRLINRQTWLRWILLLHIARTVTFTHFKHCTKKQNTRKFLFCSSALISKRTDRLPSLVVGAAGSLRSYLLPRKSVSSVEKKKTNGLQDPVVKTATPDCCGSRIGIEEIKITASAFGESGLAYDGVEPARPSYILRNVAHPCFQRTNFPYLYKCDGCSGSFNVEYDCFYSNKKWLGLCCRSFLRRHHLCGFLDDVWATTEQRSVSSSTVVLPGARTIDRSREGATNLPRFQLSADPGLAHPPHDRVTWRREACL